MANSENLRNLQKLGLNWNEIGQGGAEALANSENLRNLQRLGVVFYSLSFLSPDFLPSLSGCFFLLFSSTHHYSLPACCFVSCLFILLC